MTLSSFPTFVDAITSRSHILKIHTLSLTFSVTSPSKDPFSSNCRPRNIFIVLDQLSPIAIVVTPLLFEFQLPFWSNPLLTNDLRNSGRISFSAVVCHEYSLFFSFSLRHLPYSLDYFLHMSSSCFLLCILIALIICTASVTMQTSLLFSICSSLYSRSLSYYCFPFLKYLAALRCTLDYFPRLHSNQIPFGSFSERPSFNSPVLRSKASRVSLSLTGTSDCWICPEFNTEIKISEKD